MSHWMTSGASRLRAKQNRSFGLRANQRASSKAADSLISTNAPVSSVCGPGQKKRRNTAFGAKEGSIVSIPPAHTRAKPTTKDLAHSLDDREMNYFGGNPRRILSMTGHQSAPPPGAAQLQEAARRLAAQPPNRSLAEDQGHDDTSEVARDLSSPEPSSQMRARAGVLPADHADLLLLNQQRALLLQREVELLGGDAYGAHSLLDPNKLALLAGLSGGLPAGGMGLPDATAGLGFDPVQMEIERFRLQALQEEMILRDQLREQILLRRQQDEAAIHSMVAQQQSQNEQRQRFLSAFHETDQIAALQERRLAQAGTTLRTNSPPYTAATLGAFGREDEEVRRKTSLPTKTAHAPAPSGVGAKVPAVSARTCRVDHEQKERAAPERTALERAVLERAALERAAPEQVAPKRAAALERAAPEQAGPKRAAAPKRAAPEQAGPKRSAAPDRAALEQAVLERAALERVKASSFHTKKTGPASGFGSPAAQSDYPETADREELATLQRLHLKQEKALSGNVHDYHDSFSRKKAPQSLSPPIVGGDPSMNPNTKGKRKMAQVAPKKRNVKPKASNKKDEESGIAKFKQSQQVSTNGPTSPHFVGCVSPVARKYTGETVQTQKDSAIPSLHEQIAKETQQQKTKQAKKRPAKSMQSKTQQPLSSGGPLKQRSSLTRRVSDFKEDLHQPAAMRNITPPEPASNPPKLRYFNNGVEVDVNGVPVISPGIEDEQPQTAKPKTIEPPAADTSHTVHQTGSNASSGNSSLPRTQKAKSVKPAKIRARTASPKLSSVKKQGTAKKKSSSTKPPATARDELPALPKSFHVADLLSFVRAHIPELSSALAMLESQHKVAAAPSAYHQDNAAQSRAVDAILNELYHIVEGGLIEGLPAERGVGSAKDDDQLRARTATCIGAIEICRRRHMSRSESSTVGSGNLLPSPAIASVSSTAAAGPGRPQNRGSASPPPDLSANTPSFPAAAASAPSLLRPLIPNTKRNSLSNIAPKPPPPLPKIDESKTRQQHAQQDSDARKPNAQQFHARNQSQPTERPAAGVSTMPRRISCVSECNMMKYPPQKKQRRRSSMQSTGHVENGGGPHSELMGEIFGKEQSPPKEIDSKPSDFTEDPSKLAQASVDELVQDSLREREKTLSAASVLLGFISGNKS